MKKLLFLTALALLMLSCDKEEVKPEPPKPPTLYTPAVSTGTATDIDYNRAKLDGSIAHNGGATIIERGFVWSLTPNPTIADNKVLVDGTTGGFSIELTNLQAKTNYYFKAFATNSVGTKLGDDGEFTTESISRSGLRHWWEFNENLTSVSGVELNSTVVPSYGSGKRGQSLEFLGNAKVYKHDLIKSLIQGSNPYTFLFWVKTTETDGVLISTLSFPLSTGWTAGEPYIEIIDGKIVNSRMARTPGNPNNIRGRVTSNEIINDGTWHHVAAVFSGINDGMTLMLYIDGVLQNETATSDININTDAIYLGSRHINDDTFVGSIDDFVIYNRALSVEEINLLKNL